MSKTLMFLLEETDTLLELELMRQKLVCRQNIRIRGKEYNYIAVKRPTSAMVQTQRYRIQVSTQNTQNNRQTD